MELVQQQALSPTKAGCPVLPGGFTPAKHIRQESADLDYSILSHRKTFESSLSSLFGNDKEESKVQKARAMLGATADSIPDEELATYLTQFQYLLEEWLNTYEKQLFNGLTLQELLRER